MILISHRGRSDHFPENSIDGFREAILNGADGIETDVRLTADGELALIHDRILKNGYCVQELTLAELRQSHGYHVPTLSEALAIGVQTHWFIELKSPAAAPAMIEFLKKMKPGPRITVISFWHHLVQEIAAKTGIAYGVNLGHCPRDDSLCHTLEHLSLANASTVIWNYEFLDERSVKRTLEGGFICLAYNVCNRRDFRRCAEWKLSGVIVDRMDSAISDMSEKG